MRNSTQNNDKLTLEGRRRRLEQYFKQSSSNPNLASKIGGDPSKAFDGKNKKNLNANPSEKTQFERYRYAITSCVYEQSDFV